VLLSLETRAHECICIAPPKLQLRCLIITARVTFDVLYGDSDYYFWKQFRLPLM